MAAMPQLVKLHEELKDTGFILIGNHVQNAEREDIIPILRSLKAGFTVTSFSSVSVPNMPDGIPRAFLFDSKGELVMAGRPLDMKKAVHELVEKEPHFLAAGREYKALGRIAYALKKTKVYGPIIRTLEREAQKEGDAKEEAEYLLGRIRGYGTKLLEKARELEAKDALAALEAYKEVSVKWKGDEAGDKASARLSELEDDETFQDELRAAKVAAQLRASLEKLVSSPGGSIDLSRRENRGISASVTRGFFALKQRYPDATATASLEKELESLGFDLGS